MSTEDTMAVTLAGATELLRAPREVAGVDFTGLDLRRALPKDAEGVYQHQVSPSRDAKVARRGAVAVLARPARRTVAPVLTVSALAPHPPTSRRSPCNLRVARR